MEPMEKIDKATLVLYLNLGGEMVYILQQRLSAQKVAQDKSGRVLQEVIGCFLCPDMMGEFLIDGNSRVPGNPHRCMHA